MRKPAHCIRCGAEMMFSSPVHIGSSEGFKSPYIEVQEHPEALLFKGPHRGSLRAWVCGSCGYTELYTENAHILYKVHDQARRRHERAEAERQQHPAALLLRPAAYSDDAEPEQLLRPAHETHEDEP